MNTSYVAGRIGFTSGGLTTTVVSRDPSTDKFQWAVSIKPEVADQERTEYRNSAQNPLHKHTGRSSTGSTVVSPDGHHLS